MRQSLLGTPQLEKIARDMGLLTPDMTDVRKRTPVIESMRDHIVITVIRQRAARAIKTPAACTASSTRIPTGAAVSKWSVSC